MKHLCLKATWERQSVPQQSTKGKSMTEKFRSKRKKLEKMEVQDILDLADIDGATLQCVKVLILKSIKTVLVSTHDS